MICGHGGHANHGKAPILELAKLPFLQIEAGLLRKFQGVEAKVTGLTVHLPDPSVMRGPAALHEHGEDGDLHNAERSNLVRIESVESQSPIRLHGQARDVGPLLHDHAREGEHADAAMLDLCLAEPLDMGVCHDHVEVEVPVIQLAEAHGVPRNAARLHIRADHGLERLLAARYGRLGVHLPFEHKGGAGVVVWRRDYRFLHCGFGGHDRGSPRQGQRPSHCRKGADRPCGTEARLLRALARGSKGTEGGAAQCWRRRGSSGGWGHEAGANGEHDVEEAHGCEACKGRDARSVHLCCESKNRIAEPLS
mmetsp:Transcript_61588/g.132451  ORF Transcript_61588/g.132451 Transcript_61588/m.132451 type:complete len:308 (-) Transcript_61588:7-930(-)